MTPHRRRVPRQVRLRRTILVTTAILFATAFGIYYSVQSRAPMTHRAASSRLTTSRSHPTTTQSFPAANPHPKPSTTSVAPHVGIRVPRWTTLATLRGSVSGYSVPAAVGLPRLVAPAWGAAVTLPVVARRPHWLEVRLIGRPNGQTTWVLATDVSLTRTPYFMMIDLSRKHLLVFRMGKLMLYAPAGVGASLAPTPVGQYFVAFFTQSPSPGYGPFVIVTSGLASTVTDWEEEGTPVLTLNGPLDSTAFITSGGAAVSQGSVRLMDDDLQRLRSIPAGTPIDVVPTVTPAFTRPGSDGGRTAGAIKRSQPPGPNPPVPQSTGRSRWAIERGRS